MARNACPETGHQLAAHGFKIVHSVAGICRCIMDLDICDLWSLGPVEELDEAGSVDNSHPVIGQSSTW